MLSCFYCLGIAEVWSGIWLFFFLLLIAFWVGGAHSLVLFFFFFYYSNRKNVTSLRSKASSCRQCWNWTCIFWSHKRLTPSKNFFTLTHFLPHLLPFISFLRASQDWYIFNTNTHIHVHTHTQTQVPWWRLEHVASQSPAWAKKKKKKEEKQTTKQPNPLI